MLNQVVAITGGNSGIGLAISKLYLGKGCKVAIFSRSTEIYESLRKLYAENIFMFSGDVAHLADLETFYHQCSKKWGGIDTLIANAGIALPESIECVTEESFEKSINTNLKGVFFTVQKSLDHLNSEASITLLSSIQAHMGAGIWAVYGATKAAVRSLARSFAQELGSKGIRVNSLSPGVTDTPILKKFGFSNDELTAILEQVSDSTPLGRIGVPEEIAQAAVFLSSKSASFITGADLQVDGGLTQI